MVTLPPLAEVIFSVPSFVSIIGVVSAYFVIFAGSFNNFSRPIRSLEINSSACSIIMQKHNTELLVGMVRQQFRKNMHETDPEKIQKLKDE